MHILNISVSLEQEDEFFFHITLLEDAAALIDDQRHGPNFHHPHLLPNHFNQVTKLLQLEEKENCRIRRTCTHLFIALGWVIITESVPINVQNAAWWREVRWRMRLPLGHSRTHKWNYHKLESYQMNSGYLPGLNSSILIKYAGGTLKKVQWNNGYAAF